MITKQRERLVLNANVIRPLRHCSIDVTLTKSEALVAVRASWATQARAGPLIREGNHLITDLALVGFGGDESTIVDFMDLMRMDIFRCITRAVLNNPNVCVTQIVTRSNERSFLRSLYSDGLR